MWNVGLTILTPKCSSANAMIGNWIKLDHKILSPVDFRSILARTVGADCLMVELLIQTIAHESV
jgi:hypothetical protein